MRDPYGSSPFERAEQLVDRRRLLIGLCVAVAIALIAAVVGVLTGGGGDKSVRATGAATAGTTTTAVDDGAVSAELGVPMPTVPPASSTTTQPPSVLGTSFTQVPTTTTPKAGGKAAPPTGTPPTTAAPTTPSSCRNSYDPACGQFRWDPDPGPNQPIAGTVTASQQTPGGPVTFTVTGDDPDAAPLLECNIDYGDKQNVHCDPRPSIDPSYCPKQYGPWTPPAKNDGKLNSTSDHTYATPGTYHVVFEVRSAMQDCNNPYASSAQLSADVVVS